MPVKIPVYGQQVTPTMEQQPRAQGAPVSGAVGSALSELGNVGFRAAEIAQNVANAQRAMDLQNRLGMATGELAELELESSRDNDYRNAPGRFTDGAKKIAEKYTKDLTDPVLRTAFEHEYGKLSLAKTINVKKDAFRQEVDYHKGQLDANMEVYAQQAANAKNPAEQDFILNQARVALATARESRFISDEDAVRRDNQFRAKLAEQTVLRDINVTPEVTARRLAGDPSYVPEMDSVMRQRLQHTAEVRAGVAENKRVHTESRVVADAVVARILPPRATGGTGNFDTIIRGILQREGGYVAKDGNSNAPANYGINQAANPDIDVKNLTPQRATEIYRERYWNAIEGDKLPPSTAVVAMDAAVNQGAAYANKLLKDTGGDPQAMLNKREADYKALVARDPSQARHLQGWLNRLNAVRLELGREVTSVDLNAQREAALQAADRESERTNPGNFQFRDLTRTRVNDYFSGIVRAQVAEQAVAHGAVMKAVDGAGGKQRPTNQDELFAIPGAEAAYFKLTPEQQHGIRSYLRQNSEQAEGKASKVNAQLEQSLFARMMLPPDDPQAITRAEQLTPYAAVGLTLTSDTRLREKLEQLKTPEGKAFQRRIDIVTREAERKMRAGIEGTMLAQTDPEKLADAALAFRLDLENKLEVARKAGKPTDVYLTPGKPEYVGDYAHIQTFLQSPKETIREGAARTQAARQITGAPPLQPAARPAYPTAVNPKTGETLILKDGKWQKP